jgi:hypothetical protein
MQIGRRRLLPRIWVFDENKRSMQNTDNSKVEN